MQKVVLYVNTFPKLSETFIVSKFTGLLGMGYDVHVVCRSSPPDGWDAFPALAAIPGVRRRVHLQPSTRTKAGAVMRYPLVILQALAANPSGTVGYFRTLGKRALRLFYNDACIVGLKPDILHFEFGATAPAQLHIKDVLGCKVVVSFRGYDLNFVGLDAPGYYDAVWEKADWLHLLGEDLWARAQRRGCPPDKPHTFVPPAIDTSFFQPNGAQPADDKRLIITSVGRLEWKKGYEFALAAVALLRDKGVDFRYQIVGGGSYLEPISYAVHEMGLKDHVQLLRAMPRPAVLERLQHTDIFLHNAVSEGFSNAVLEAQALQIPIVTSDADGLSENVADGVTGFVVPRRDPAATAEKLYMLATDPALRRRMGEAGRQRVQTHFEVADQPAKFAAIYEAVRGESAL